MRRCAILVIVSLQAGLAAAVAQPAGTGAAPPPSAAAPPATANPAAPMEEPAPGDHWTYEIRDEVLGTVKFTVQSVVTEVTPKDISTRYTIIGKPNNGSIIFDRSWNVKLRGPWRFSPNDGRGIRLPLAVGKTWRFRVNAVNSKNGESWTRSGTSKVVAQESMTTRAGTFDTFKIVTTVATHNVNNPSRTAQFETETWYAPTIDHWVKRTEKTRVSGHLVDNTSLTLVACGRRQQ